jgi:cytochrome c oxidase cbb3-type subunit 3
MTDFTSEFWSWFIIILTLGGIIGMVWMLRALSGKPPKEVKTMGHVWDEDLEELNNPLPAWWLGLFYITIVFAVGYFILYPGMGTFKGMLDWTQKGQYESEIKKADEKFAPLYDEYRKQDIAVLAKNTEAMKTGARLFVNYCTTCHSSDARGGIGFPNLRDTDWLYGGAAEQIKASIMNGRAGVMPAWQAALGEDGVKEVTEYVLGLNGRRVDNELAARGKQRFMATCAACHGADATGNIALGAPNLTNNIWLYGGSRKAITDSIANGRNGNMPAHGEFLGDAKVHLLAAYVFQLSESQE